MGAQFPYFIISPWILAFAVILLALFGWLMSSMIVWLFAKTLGGKAGFRDTLGIVGYSFGPLITASFIANMLIALLGPPIGTVSSTTWVSFAMFDLVYLPFFVLVVYHCGNGIQSAHLLNKYYSYGICSFITVVYIIGFVIPAIF
jgi:hypothetical protein